MLKSGKSPLDLLGNILLLILYRPFSTISIHSNLFLAPLVLTLLKQAPDLSYSLPQRYRSALVLV